MHVNQPVLGIIAERVTSHEHGLLFGPLSIFIRQLIEHAQDRGWQAYVFSSADVLKQRRLVWGWTRKHGEWNREFFPPPHVGYIRTQVRKAEIPILDWLREEMSTQFINQQEVEEIAADRWRVLQIGLSHPTLNERFPDAVLMRKGASLETALAMAPDLLLIPRYVGTRTFGRIQQTAQGYTLRFFDGRAGTTYSYTTVDSLKGQITDLYDELVVWPNREPLRIEQCPVGFRVFWQRDQSNRWKESYCALRLGLPNTAGEVMATAGRIDPYTGMLKKIVGSQFDSLRYQLSNTSKTFVDLIDKRSHGAGELAVDMMIGVDKSIRITDLTTLGGMKSLKQIHAPELSAGALHNTLGYAQFLYEQAFALSELSSVRS